MIIGTLEKKTYKTRQANSTRNTGEGREITGDRWENEANTWYALRVRVRFSQDVTRRPDGRKEDKKCYRQKSNNK